MSNWWLISPKGEVFVAIRASQAAALPKGEKLELPDNPPKEIVKTARENANLTQQQLSDISGIRQEYISRIESGQITPRPGTLAKIIAALQRNSPK
jgi:ribosome-binding protein aMBF1 (putative translation factor)